MAAVLYFHCWKGMLPSGHMALGWIYLAFAWLSLFFIHGILSFMLTPGRWIVTGSFRDGFFNPTLWPSLALRSFICVMLAGLYVLLVASRCRAGGLKARFGPELLLVLERFARCDRNGGYPVSFNPGESPASGRLAYGGARGPARCLWPHRSEAAASSDCFDHDLGRIGLARLLRMVP